MGVLALALLIIWGLGIVLSAWATVTVVKDGSHPQADRFWQLYEQHPQLVLLVLTVLTVFWPATLVFNLVNNTRGN